MTAFVRTAAGNWSDPAKWNIGAGYPSATTDTADLATFAVTADVDFTCGDINLPGAGAAFTIPAGRTVDMIGASIWVRSGAAFDITGMLQCSNAGTVAGIILYSGATYTANAGAEFKRVLFEALSGTWVLSALISDCSEANMALNTITFYNSQLTMDVSTSFRYFFAYNNSAITINPGLTFSVYLGGYIKIYQGATFDINGTRAAPVTFKSRVTGDIWYFYLYGGTTGSDIDYLICEGSPWSFGDNTDGFIFTRKPQDITPPHRIPIIEDDEILGRGASRVHYKGNHAAIVEISGMWAVADKQYERVDTMMDKGSVVGFASDEIFIPNARILDHEYTRKAGRLYWPYTITLVEDV